MAGSVTLAHLSDVHLPFAGGVPIGCLNVKRALGWLNWQRKRRFVHQREALDKLVADVRREMPDHLLVSGDLVNIGLPREYRAARIGLQRLGRRTGSAWFRAITMRTSRVKQSLGWRCGCRICRAMGLGGPSMARETGFRMCDGWGRSRSSGSIRELRRVLDRLSVRWALSSGAGFRGCLSGLAGMVWCGSL